MLYRMVSSKRYNVSTLFNQDDFNSFLYKVSIFENEIIAINIKMKPSDIKNRQEEDNERILLSIIDKNCCDDIKDLIVNMITKNVWNKITNPTTKQDIWQSYQLRKLQMKFVISAIQTISNYDIFYLTSKELSDGLTLYEKLKMEMIYFQDELKKSKYH